MNDHHPYDQSLRDKLNNLPVPDVQKSWHEMRKLLDEEMPEGGRSRRRGGWWFFSSVLIFIIAGSWILFTIKFSKQNVDPPLSSTKTILSAPDTKPPVARLPGAESTEPGTPNDSEKAGAADDKILLSKEERSNEKENIDGPSGVRTEKGGKNSGSVVAGIEPAAVNQPHSNSPGSNSSGSNPLVSNPSNNNLSNGNRSKTDPATVQKNSSGQTPGNQAQIIVAASVPKGKTSLTGDGSVLAKSASGSTTAGPEKGVQQNTMNKPEAKEVLSKEALSGEASSKEVSSREALSNEASSVEGLSGVGLSKSGSYKESSSNETFSMEPSDVLGVERLPSGSITVSIDSINKNYGSSITYAPVSRKYYRQNKKYGRPVNVRAPYTTVGRNFAVGLSLPLVFPIGDQQALSYNVNAGHNTSTDYIPAPHAQYHFNGTVYIQSELQVLSPQYIKPALLYQTKTSNNFYQTISSVSAQKLYYFNVPLSLHYSPFKHFYMGTGLQFSSLLSGVAMHEQHRTGMVSSDSIYNVNYAKFSNDSISNKLSGSEMRLMLDANYYWNKFTVGLRYNQALSNYVSTRANPSAPLTVDKNKSIQFYLRYNLWEDKKRKTTGSQPLVVK